MFGAILKATNSSFQKGMTFCRSIYVKKVMKLLAFIFEQPSYDQEMLKGKCKEQWLPHDTKNTIKVKQPALSSQANDCNTWKSTKYCTTKHGPNTEPPQTTGATINNEKTNAGPPVHNLEMNSVNRLSDNQMHSHGKHNFCPPPPPPKKNKKKNQVNMTSEYHNDLSYRPVGSNYRLGGTHYRLGGHT